MYSVCPKLIVLDFIEPGHSISYKIACAPSELRSVCNSVQYD